MRGGDRARRRPEGALDIDRSVDELYTAGPDTFIARRDELAKEAKAAGDAAGARLVRALHRPTLAAWASNLLVRDDPTQVEQFLELGEALRAAHRDLDRQQMRELSAQQGRIITALTEQAARLAADAGHRLSDTVRQDVATTLRAVLGDPQAAEQWATAQLATTLTPPAAFTPAITPSNPPHQGSATASRRSDNNGDAGRQHEERIARARQDAKAAADAVRTHRREQEAAAKAQDRAAEKAHRARQQVEAAKHKLHQAKDAAQNADGRLQQAQEERRTADEALARAESAERNAAREMERLARGPRRTSR